MDNRRYAELLDATTSKYGKWNVPRSFFNVGINSDEQTCHAKNMYLIVENKPTIDTATQKQGSQHIVFDDVAKVWNVTYDVVEIPLEELQAKEAKLVETTIQKILDDSSVSRGYDNIVSECSYATSTGEFGTEAQITVDWRDAVWTYVFTVQATVEAGGAKPTLEELIAGLPVRA